MNLADVISTKAVRTVFQPIVDLGCGTVVGYESLSRGPVGALERPDALFAAARAQGLLAELDSLCRSSALRNAANAGLTAPMSLFINVEPAIMGSLDLDELAGLVDAGPHGVQVVLEITERALSARPAEMLATVRRLRSAGWRIALDDVGADDMSLAFMPLLQPDVVKLDIKLVQERPGPAVAKIMNAVNAHAERTGALILAEGIENERHVEMAQALGARLAQGFLFGRPAERIDTTVPASRLELIDIAPSSPTMSPFECLPTGAVLRRAPKPLLVEVSKHLERAAAAQGSACVVLAAFQYARHFTPATADRYAALADQVGFVAAIGDSFPIEPVPGVRGAAIDPDDVLRHEWDVIVLAPHFAAALLARDLGDDVSDTSRRFEFALTYDHAAVCAAAESLLTRVVQVPNRTLATV